MTAVRACALSELADESVLAADVAGVEVAVVRSGGRVYAIRDECSHAAVPLSEGEVGGGEIECWLHGSRFDLATGKPTGPPAVEPVAIYPVTVDGDDVLVDVSSPLDPTSHPQSQESRS